MPFRKYFGGIRIELRSPLSPARLKEQINAQASWGLSPFYTGVVGRVWGQTLRLKYRSSIMEYSEKPLLTGRIEAVPSGSRLPLVYRAPRSTLPFFIFWFGFLLLAFIGTSVSLVSNRDFDSAMILALLPVFASVPIAMHAWGTRRWDEDLAALLDFLEREAQAIPASRPPVLGK